MMAVLLEARIEARAADGVRTLDAHDFFLGPLTTALKDDEIVTQITLLG